MSERGRSWRARTFAAITIVGAFYGAASFALVSTDSAPAAPASASSGATAEKVVLVGATRSGQNPPLQGLCRIPGWPFCPPKTTTTTRTVTTTLPGRTVTATETVPVTVTATETVPVTVTVTATVTEVTTTTSTTTRTSD